MADYDGQKPDDRLHRLAKKGGEASATSRLRSAPLRAVVETVLVDGETGDRLECGHVVKADGGLFGKQRPKSRRCLECLDKLERDAAEPSGHH